MRKTKIVCTLGPATDDEKILEDMMLAGMNVARFNFSHGTQADHLNRMEVLDRLRRKHGLPVAALLDTKGPEIRIGKFQGGFANLKKGQSFILTQKNEPGDETHVYVNCSLLAQDVKPGATLLIDDGLVGLTVENVKDGDIYCRVQNDGRISDTKGVNAPGTSLSMPFVSDKDREDIVFGIHNGFDFIAASFTRSAEDILQIRAILEEEKCSNINIIAKIENMEGVHNIDEIIKVSDGIMVARGDMGVEIPLEDVPVIQKKVIERVYSKGKPVITATQMLDSMIKNPRPTRAEAADVANAIYDGTSAIMLSGETAAGLYPVEAVKTMAKIAERAERDIDYDHRSTLSDGRQDVTSAISHATCTTARDIHAQAIITVTKSGQTARMVSKFRPASPIICCTTSERVYHQMNLCWGVLPLIIDEKKTTDELFDSAIDSAVDAGLLQSGDLAVITAGVPLGISGTTNMMKVQVAGHILVSGRGLNKRTAVAKLCVCKDEKQAQEKFKDGDILVIPDGSGDLMPIMRRAAGVITENNSRNSPIAIAGLLLDIPVIIGAANACRLLRSGVTVTIDAEHGIVSASGKPESK